MQTFIYFRNLLLLCLPLSFFSVHGQTNDFSIIKNSAFPESWDNNRELRGRNGLVLAWTHTKSGKKNEGKSCITLIFGLDSIGNTEYFVIERYTNEKPFTKWDYAWIHYLPNNVDSVSGLRVGFFDNHIKRFEHQPTEKEVYDLFSKSKPPLFW